MPCAVASKKAAREVSRLSEGTHIHKYDLEEQRVSIESLQKYIVCGGGILESLGAASDGFTVLHCLAYVNPRGMRLVFTGANTIGLARPLATQKGRRKRCGRYMLG